MNNLTPTQIVDKNGKQTTVRKNLSKGSEPSSRLTSVGVKTPQKFPVREVRAILAERYDRMDEKRRASFVAKDLKAIRPLLDGTETNYFGKLSSAVSEQLDDILTPNKELRDRAKRLVEAAGREDVVANAHLVPTSDDFEYGDSEALTVLADGPTKTVYADVETDAYRNPFRISQIINRKSYAESADADPRMLGTYYGFEYMGSSEYEFGAVAESRKNILSAPEIQYTEAEFEFNGIKRPVYFIGSDIATAVAYMKDAEKKGDISLVTNTVERSRFDDAFEAGGSYGVNDGQTAWWALRSGGDFLYSLDRDRIEDIALVLHRGQNESQSIVNVDVQIKAS